MASNEEIAAQDHQNQFDASAQEEQKACDSSTDAYGMNICWTESINPTEEHRALAEKHRALAAKHRSASQALVQAEEAECQGVSDLDRTISPFGHAKDVISVQRVVRTGDRLMTSGGALSNEGVEIVIAAVPDLTLERLQHLIDCHLARNAALGHSVPEMPYCPLVPDNVEAIVEPAKDGFAVRVTSPNTEVALRLWERAQLIKTGG